MKLMWQECSDCGHETRDAKNRLLGWIEPIKGGWQWWARGKTGVAKSKISAMRAVEREVGK